MNFLSILLIIVHMFSELSRFLFPRISINELSFVFASIHHLNSRDASLFSLSVYVFFFWPKEITLTIVLQFLFLLLQKKKERIEQKL